MGLKNENLFHQVLAQAKNRPLNEVWGVCVSGGLDSMSLLHLVHEASKITGHLLEVFYIHHGPEKGQGTEQAVFRSEAYDLIQKLCIQKQLRLHSNYSVEGGANSLGNKWPDASEASLREFRWKCLKKLSSAFNDSITFLTGHHQDDVLETRMIQLIRGTSLEGVASFRAASPGIWRPLFQFSKLDLESLGVRQKWEWVEDPSNQNLGPLRNWMRQEWLPQLEEKRRGSKKSLHRSLESIVNALDLDNVALAVNEKGLSRAEFMALSRREQLQSLAHLLKTRGNKSFTLGQLEEILKRLGANLTHMQFEVGKMCWKVNKFYIQASRV